MPLSGLNARVAQYGHIDALKMRAQTAPARILARLRRSIVIRLIMFATFFICPGGRLAFCIGVIVVLMLQDSVLSLFHSQAPFEE